MSGVAIAKAQQRFKSSLTVLAPEHPLDLPSELNSLYELLVALTRDGLEESQLALNDALETRGRSHRCPEQPQ